MRYGPADSSQTPRFTGARTFMRLPSVETTQDVDVAVIGIPTDDAVSYKSGARFGPEGIRSASALLRPYNPLLRVDVTEHLSMVDYGDSPTVPGYHEETLHRIEDYLAPVHDRRGDSAVPGRRPLDGARRAASRGGRPRPAGARPPRRPRGRLGVVLRRTLLPRHGVQARRRGGAGRAARLGAGRDAGHALRRGGRRPRPASWDSTRSRGTSSSRSGPSGTASAFGRASATVRRSCRSTSTSSTRRSRRRPARRKSAGRPAARRWPTCGR